MTEYIGYMACSEPRNALQLIRTVVGKPAGKFAVVFIAERHNVALLKAAFDALYANWK